jgi:hypothetical protein
MVGRSAVVESALRVGSWRDSGDCGLRSQSLTVKPRARGRRPGIVADIVVAVGRIAAHMAGHAAAIGAAGDPRRTTDSGRGPVGGPVGDTGQSAA